MSSKPSSSTSYRDPNVDDDDDLDDLDDVLASFNAPKLDSITSKQSQVSSPQTTRATFPSTASTSAPIPSETEETDEDFEDSLVEGMESLLRQLASDHPPGPMPDAETSKPTGQPLVPGLERTEGEASLSAEEEEQAWQKALEMMLSGEGLEALGLDKNGVGDQSRAAVVPQGGEAKPDFQETIRRTMESLNQPATSGARRATGAGDGAPPNLAALLSQLGSDPSALDGLGGDDGELGGLLDGMMAQLMTREVLEEPMSELASKYPAYLAAPPSTVSQAELAKYRQQHALVQQILETFRRPGYSDEKDGKEVARLVGEMQDLGGPPKEIMGELPEGFDLGALGAAGLGDECTIM